MFANHRSFAKLQFGILTCLLLLLSFPLFAQTETTSHLCGDTNNDGVVDVTDSRNIAADLGGPPSGNYGDTDLNDDGVVDKLDVNLLAQAMIDYKKTLSENQITETNNTLSNLETEEETETITCESGSLELANGDVFPDNTLDDFDLLDVLGDYGNNGSYPDHPEMNNDDVVDDFEINIINGAFGNSGAEEWDDTVVPANGPYAIRIPSVSLGDYTVNSDEDLKPYPVRIWARKKVDDVLQTPIYEYVVTLTKADKPIFVPVPEDGEYAVQARALSIYSSKENLGHWLIAEDCGYEAFLYQAGYAFPWQNEIAGWNTLTDNKRTDVPLAAWQSRGRLGIDMQLHHNSQTREEDRGLGAKWSHSYEIYLDESPRNSTTPHSRGDVRIKWGDGQSYAFAKGTTAFTAPAGIYQTLEKLTSPDRYVLTTKEGFQYRFELSSSMRWYCTSIEDMKSDLDTQSGHYKNKITLNYDSNKRLTSVSDPINNSISFSYTNGHVTQITAPVTGMVDINYTTTWNDLSYLFFPSSIIQRPTFAFSYSSTSNIENVLSPNNTSYDYTYQSKDNLTGSQVDDDDCLLCNAILCAITLCRGFDECHGNSNVPVLPPGFTDWCQWCDWQQAEDYKNCANWWLENYGITSKYDKNNRVEHTNTNSPGTVERPEWNESNQNIANRIGNTFPYLQTTYSYNYDTYGNLLTYRNPNHQTGDPTLALEYNGCNMPTEVTDRLGNTTTNEYYGNSAPEGYRLKKTTDPNGNSTWYGSIDSNGQFALSYDEYGNYTAVKDANDNITKLTYDSTGSYIIKTEQPKVDDTRTWVECTRNSIGWVNTVQNKWQADGQTVSSLPATTYVYDNPTGNVTQVINTLGNSVYYQYDILGNPTKTTDSNGNFVKYEYDNQSRVTSVKTGTHDTAYPYDEINVITRAQYEYDCCGDRTVSITDGNDKTITRQNNEKRQLESITYYASTEAWTYDAYGLPDVFIDRSNIETKYIYDLARQLTGINYGNDTSIDVEYEYDDTGNMVEMTDDNGTTEWEYDDAGQLIGYNSPQGYLTYEYDAVGNLNWVQLNDTINKKWSYNYDEANRLTSTTFDPNINQQGDELVTGYQYDGANRLTQKDNANGTFTVYNYQLTNPLLTISHYQTNNTLIQSYAYSYDSAGRVYQTVVSGTNPGTNTYAYDEANQLIEETWNGTNSYEYEYTYDNNGNRLTKSEWGLVTENYHYAAGYQDRLESVYDGDDTNTLRSFTYDTNGNVNLEWENGSGYTAYSYNTENQLTGIDYGADTSWDVTYNYNGLGSMVSRTENNVTTAYLPDSKSALQKTGQNSQTYYTWAGGIESEYTAGTSLWYHTDNIGSTRALSNDSQSVVGSWNYDAYGNITNASNPQTPYGFLGSYGFNTEVEGLLLFGGKGYNSQCDKILNDIKNPAVIFGTPPPNIEWDYKNLSDVPVPLLPHNHSYEENGREASTHQDDFLWLINKVKSNGDWDYKKYDKQYENSGNYNYGYVCRSANIPYCITLGLAGAYQFKSKTWRPDWYGSNLDDPKDQYYIRKGYNDADKHLQGQPLPYLDSTPDFSQIDPKHSGCPVVQPPGSPIVPFAPGIPPRCSIIIFL